MAEILVAPCREALVARGCFDSGPSEGADVAVVIELPDIWRFHQMWRSRRAGGVAVRWVPPKAARKL